MPMATPNGPGSRPPKRQDSRCGVGGAGDATVIMAEGIVRTL